MHDSHTGRAEAFKYQRETFIASHYDSSDDVQLDLDDLNVENAYFRSFDAIVRRQLDPVWHKVGPKTKQLVSDLATLRNLLKYSCSTIISAQTLMILS